MVNLPLPLTRYESVSVEDPRDVMARFFPEWQPWPTAYGVKP